MSVVKYREELDQLHSYSPAKTLDQIKKEFGVDKILKLAGNENTMGYSPLVSKAIQKVEKELFLYPDSQCQLLREELAKLYKIRQDQLVFGNGSFELLSLLAQAFLRPGEESIIPEPSFGWYKNVTLAMGGIVKSVPLDQHAINLYHILDEVTNYTKIIWLCNPNNPTGTYFNKEQLEEFLEAVPSNIIILLDEAYFEYVLREDYPDSTSLLEKHSNIIILRTFSKIYGLASLRIGYAIANPELIDPINKIRLPVNVNKLAQVAAAASLQDQTFKETCITNNNIGKSYFSDVFKAMNLEYIPSETNFIMVNIEQDSVLVAYELLRKGISIRPGSDFGMHTWLRITIGKPDENQTVAIALQEILSTLHEGGELHG